MIGRPSMASFGRFHLATTRLPQRPIALLRANAAKIDGRKTFTRLLGHQLGVLVKGNQDNGPRRAAFGRQLAPRWYKSIKQPIVFPQLSVEHYARFTAS